MISTTIAVILSNISCRRFHCTVLLLLENIGYQTLTTDFLFSRLSHPPEFIMLENVKGFDTSEAHELLIETLIKCNYQFAEFLLSPTQFSIPNSRQRYYLIARKAKQTGDHLSKAEYVANIHSQVPLVASDQSIFANDAKVSFVDHISLCSKSSPTVKPGNFCSTIEPYLDSTVEPAQFEPTSDTLLRYHALFDLVTRHSTSTNCFTKSYAHRIEGCGSILMTASNLSMDGVYAEIAQLKSQQQTDDADDETSGKIVQLLRSLGLRFFTPREVANLMSFPPNFGRYCSRYRLTHSALSFLLKSFTFFCYRVSARPQSEAAVSCVGKLSQRAGVSVLAEDFAWP